MTSAASFEWWDASGVRHVNAGDADLVPGNVKDSVDIFGVSGSVVDASTIDPWDLRAGTAIGTTVGKLPVACANGINLAMFDAGPIRHPTVDTTTDVLTLAGHGFADGAQVRVDTGVPTGLSAGTDYFVKLIDADTFQLATTLGGTAVDLQSAGSPFFGVFAWNDGVPSYADALDDYTGALSQSGGTLVATPGTDYCSGLEVTPGDSGVWRDVTSGGGCAANPSGCRYEDKITRRQWSPVASVYRDWFGSMIYCDTLIHDGLADWRLPTLYEMMTAYTHEITSITDPTFVTSPFFISASFYTATTSTADLDKAWYFGWLGITSTDKVAGVTNPIICVR
jgi:hypothetical protein